MSVGPVGSTKAQVNKHPLLSRVAAASRAPSSKVALGGLHRWGWLLLCVPLWAGPTQGATGGCSSEGDPLDEPAQVRPYCEEREELECVRAYERGDLTLLQREECRLQALALCELRTFVPGCAPTLRETGACLNALHSRSTLQQTADEIPECRRICDYEAQDAAVVASGGEDEAE